MPALITELVSSCPPSQLHPMIGLRANYFAFYFKLGKANDVESLQTTVDSNPVD